MLISETSTLGFKLTSYSTLDSQSVVVWIWASAEHAPIDCKQNNRVRRLRKWGEDCAGFGTGRPLGHPHLCPPSVYFFTAVGQQHWQMHEAQCRGLWWDGVPSNDDGNLFLEPLRKWLCYWQLFHFLLYYIKNGQNWHVTDSYYISGCYPPTAVIANSQTFGTNCSWSS